MSISNYFYGPVPSRRLGFSLGVDLFSGKTCTFDCLYCQLGHCGKKTAGRFYSLKPAKFKAELKAIADRDQKIDYITISGSGEPTLHKDLDKIITVIKKITNHKYPVAVITNSSLLYLKKVRNELKPADLVVPSLDAASPETFSKINRPVKGITFERIVNGLIRLRKEFKGKIWLEIMLISGVNDTKPEIDKFRKIIDKINPDKIQLNLPVRPAGTKLPLPSKSKIDRVKKALGKNCEVVVKFSSVSGRSRVSMDLEKDIINFLKVRPATFDDLARSLAANPNQIIKQLTLLLKNKSIKERMIKRVKYFVIAR